MFPMVSDLPHYKESEHYPVKNIGQYCRPYFHLSMMISAIVHRIGLRYNNNPVKPGLKRIFSKTNTYLMRTRVFSKILFFWSKSHENKLSKADRSLQRTQLLVPKVPALDRYYCDKNL